jgi:hypothetical protein
MREVTSAWSITLSIEACILHGHFFQELLAELFNFVHALCHLGCQSMWIWVASHGGCGRRTGAPYIACYDRPRDDVTYVYVSDLMQQLSVEEGQHAFGVKRLMVVNACAGGE